MEKRKIVANLSGKLFDLWSIRWFSKQDIKVILLLTQTKFGTFVDVADQKIDDFNNVKISYGTGLRLQLTEMAKLRFYFGVQPEGWGLFFTFNEAF